MVKNYVYISKHKLRLDQDTSSQEILKNNFGHFGLVYANNL